ncbi:glycosyl hydrolase 115 family protein [Echinicola jeungdonensis]|uniref:Glycosyl hydrolase 115 family protein n=1 Tax=Echinicola jeungdonensis TaxID=709343 RepID=A0ABV5J9I0_9BACT|nr:glycosyl hydrolase 115 family protein [Echinicola jeungdonensis]MDN3670416.1 glycosyl hydrolase 115 family protein [Echinicola jeungdonensis]
MLLAIYQNTKNVFFALFILVLLTSSTFAGQEGDMVSSESGLNRFPIVTHSAITPILVEKEEEKGVLIAAENFLDDIKSVTDKSPKLVESNEVSQSKQLLIIGTIGKSKLIDQLIEEGKLNVSGMAGKWENYLIETIDDPIEGVEQALVIVGSDKRGTIFGIYEMSRQIGVSPWNWWADVPVEKKGELYFKNGRYHSGTPAIQYRGIFINDEAPALSGWAQEKFGGFNHKFYEKVYELILRLKANYLWPAMWGRSLYEDDPLNPVVADQYGVVIGTSHHEPLMRAHADWSRHGKGEWDYSKNKENLQQFWREGIERMGSKESLVTIGMRGDGDEPMSEESNIELLEQIVNDQREIIAEVTGKPTKKTPQVWALYKEVQEYYDKGMRVPDDVTLLLCDDNWGNVRKLPKLGEKQHSGGYGMYYHFDYVGGPRNYKWINTNHIPRIWEQMNLTYRHGVDKIWIVNVGDIKPMELPISFFLDFAWNPDNWPAERLHDYVVDWAAQQFGSAFKVEIAGLLDSYTKFNARRKPELVDEESFSLTHYNEFDRLVKEYKDLAVKAQGIYKKINPKYKSAYYQLVLFPILASSNLYEMYYAAAKNKLFAFQGRASTNPEAQNVKTHFEKDAGLTHYYNTQLEDGKWNHMMDQVHIGYTSWNDPSKDIMPEVKEINLPTKGAMGVALESGAFYPDDKSLKTRTFTPFDKENGSLTLYNQGKKPIDYKISKKPEWLKLSASSGQIEKEVKLGMDIDWSKVSIGNQEGRLIVKSGKDKAEVIIPVNKFTVPDEFEGFVEAGGYVSIEADHFTGQQTVAPVRWEVIPGLGKTGSSVTGFPVRSPDGASKDLANYLSYNTYFTTPGEHTLQINLAPTLNFHNSEEGLRFGISVDDHAPEILSMHKGRHSGEWNKWVGDAVNITTCKIKIDEPGAHEIKLWLVDSGVVVQKLVVDTGGLEKSYLGPAESTFKVKSLK